MTKFLNDITLQYFDINWISSCDGPGNRVVLYLQGCRLRCPWCHSPHSQAVKPVLLYFPALCRHCGRCARVCPHNVHELTAEAHLVRRNLCVGCGKCIEACLASGWNRPGGALALPVKKAALSDLWPLLYPQLDLLRNIGGLTVSGGEALLQSKALAGLLRLCKEEGIHTAVETSGALPGKHINDVAQLTDCWLYGLRPTPFYTPPHAGKIPENLAFLAQTGARIIIRTPVIAGITDLPGSLEHIAGTMRANGLHEIQLLPFNQDTPHFYSALGRRCRVGNGATASFDRLEAARAFFMERNFSPTVVQ